MAVAIAVAPLLVLSPFEHRLACQFQIALYDSLGIEGLHRWPSEADEQYTGVVRIWDKWGTLREESCYQLGARHGIWKEYAEDGTLEQVCEYRDGIPWNGVCQIREWKAFIAEFRDGKPFNGCVWENDANGNSIEFFFIDGRQVPVDEFMMRYTIEAAGKDTLAIRDIFTKSQWLMQSPPFAVQTPGR
jgi:hypothetical protein